MADLQNIVNPLLKTGNDSLKAILPDAGVGGFSAADIGNQGQQLLQSGGNLIASQLNELTAGARAVVNQQLPFPTKKLMTFFLLDKSGNLVIPTDGSFQKGYLFNLLINPTSFQIAYPPKTINAVRTMGGWVMQHWYPDLGTITANGIIGNLLQSANTDVKKTPNWDIFKKLIRVYQNNGVPYRTGPLKRQDTQFNPTAVIVYDRVTYSGYFENFDFTEEEANPWTRNYNLTFKFVDMVETMDIVERTRQGISTAINSTLASSSIGGSVAGLGSLLNPK